MLFSSLFTPLIWISWGYNNKRRYCVIRYAKINQAIHKYKLHGGQCQSPVPAGRGHPPKDCIWLYEYPDLASDWTTQYQEKKNSKETNIKCVDYLVPLRQYHKDLTQGDDRGLPLEPRSQWEQVGISCIISFFSSLFAATKEVQREMNNRKIRKVNKKWKEWKGKSSSAWM